MASCPRLPILLLCRWSGWYLAVRSIDYALQPLSHLLSSLFWVRLCFGAGIPLWHLAVIASRWLKPIFA